MPLPTGRVTFLFSDIEGSTRHAHRLGDEAWADLLREHDRVVDSSIIRHAGTVVKHEGDGTFAVFADGDDGVAAAVEIAQSLAHGALGEVGQGVRVRMGMHTGDGRLTDTGLDYVGIDVHYAARVAAAGNGGQIVISGVTHDGLTGITGSNLPDGATLIDEGMRKLKDFDDPRPLHRVVVPGVTDDDRPLRTEDLPSNLPSLATRFVGRETEVTELARAMLTNRLLTLTGPGGTGKTRLGIGLAETIRGRFRGGTWFVDLAPIRDPALVLGTIATAMGLREEPGVSIASTLLEHLRSIEALVVVDNLEQLLPDAAITVADLLRESSGLRFIVTSREVLRIAGEHEYQVPPLDGDEGVSLFLDRARSRGVDLDPDLEARSIVREIVDRLEGLPLAIELAAARTRLMSPKTILDRLEGSLDFLAGGARDLPERQRTLRGTIAWSHDLLSPDEQVVFRRLAVFPGGWTAEAATAVVDPGHELSLDVIDGLESLADRSLVRVTATDHGDPRFGRHVLIREYALEQLAAAGERPGCERRHALTYLEVAEEVGPHLVGDESDRWLDLIAHEEHNLRAALRWSIDVAEPGIGMRIAAAIWRFWQLRGKATEGISWTSSLLSMPEPTDPRLRIGVLSAEGGLAYWTADFATTRTRYAERLALAEGLGDDATLAEAHYELGFVGMLDQDAEMLRHHEEIALGLFERLGDIGGVVRARQALVLGHILSRAYRTAIDLELQNLAEFRRMRAGYRVTDSLTLLAIASIFDGDLEGGRTYLRESARLTSGIQSEEIAGLSVTAHLALLSADPATGARLAGAAESAALATGVTNPALSVLHLPDPAEVARERLGSAAEALIQEGGAMSMEEALTMARVFVGPAGT